MSIVVEMREMFEFMRDKAQEYCSHPDGALIIPMEVIDGECQPVQGRQEYVCGLCEKRRIKI